MIEELWMPGQEDLPPRQTLERSPSRTQGIVRARGERQDRMEPRRYAVPAPTRAP
jgi:hypothetical protein